MNEETILRIQSTYGIENWSAGYFDVNNEGNIIARPSAQDSRNVDLKQLVDVARILRTRTSNDVAIIVDVEIASRPVFDSVC